MKRLFSLVRALIAGLPPEAPTPEIPSPDAILVQQYLELAHAEGVCAAVALQYLHDELDSRLASGFCAHIECAVPRAADRCRTGPQLGAPWTQDAWIASDAPALGALPAAYDGWPQPDPFGTSLEATLGVADPYEGQPAAAADAWVLDQFGVDTLESLPNLCEHPSAKRWILADGEHFVRCPDCGATAEARWPILPLLAPVWVLADGEHIADV